MTNPVAVTVSNTGPVSIIAGNGLPGAVSTDGTYGLPTPVGVGFELVIATVGGVSGLQDIRYNGVSL